MVISRKDPVITTAPGAASKSPQTPVAQLNADPFPAGAEVEVKINSDGFFGSWYEAKLLNRLWLTRYVKFKVQYLTLLRDDGSKLPLVEDVYIKNVRPRAPLRLITPGGGNEDEDPNFKMHDLVEAYHNEGWWQGVISGLRNPENGLYTVSFANTREVFQFKPAEIRPQLDFVNGEWVPILGKPEKKGSYKKGDKVEVFQMRDDYGPSYFPARVEEVIKNSYYLVKYESSNARPNGDLTEILDPYFLRPSLDLLSKKNRFTVGSHVEVFYEGGWSPGVVSSGLSGSNYAVTVKSKGRPMTVQFDGSDMRARLQWDGRKWSSWSIQFPMDKKRKGHPGEICSDVSLTESGTPDSVTISGKKLKLKEESEEVQELESPMQNKDTSREENLESDEDAKKKKLIPIAKLSTPKLQSSASNGSSSPRIKRAVPKVSRSQKLLRELKQCHPKISKGKRSSAGKRNMKGWATEKMLDNDGVDNDGGTTSGKQKDVNVSTGGSSDQPQPNTNGEEETVHVGTTSCEPRLDDQENNIGRATSRKQKDVNLSIESSSAEPQANANEDKVNNGGETRSKKKRDVNLSIQSYSDKPQPSTNGEKEATHVGTTSCEPHLASKTNFTADLAGENAVGVSPHDRTVDCTAGSEGRCLLNSEAASPSDDVAEISKGQIDSWSTPLPRMDYLTRRDASSDPWASDEDQAGQLPLLEKSVLTEPNPNPHPNEHTSAEHTPLPFEKISPLWNFLETTYEVFRHIPQMPHFMKLEGGCKEKMEGTAIGMMTTYAHLAESIQKLSLHTEDGVFEEKLACLDSLEENGFIVDPIRTRLQRLLELKANCTKSRLKQVELETELANKEKENTSSLASMNACKAELADIDETIAKLQERKKALFEKTEGLLDSRAGLEQDILRLKDEISSTSMSTQLTPEEFGRVAAEPLY